MWDTSGRGSLKQGGYRPGSTSLRHLQRSAHLLLLTTRGSRCPTISGSCADDPVAGKKRHESSAEETTYAHFPSPLVCGTVPKLSPKDDNSPSSPHVVKTKLMPPRPSVFLFESPSFSLLNVLSETSASSFKTRAALFVLHTSVPFYNLTDNHLSFW